MDGNDTSKSQENEYIPGSLESMKPCVSIDTVVRVAGMMLQRRCATVLEEKRELKDLIDVVMMALSEKGIEIRVEPLPGL